MKPNRIILFKGVSEHNSVNGMVDAIAAAFTRCGYVCSIVNVAEGELARDMPGLIAGGDVALIFSLNGFGLPRAPGSFYDKTDIPVFLFFVDHPAYHRDRVLAPVHNLMMGFPSASHVAFCLRHYGADLSVAHIPHAAVEGTPVPWAERDIDVFFSGSPLQGDFHVSDAVLAAHNVDPLRPLEDVLDTRGQGAEHFLDEFLLADGFLRNRVKQDFLEACGDLSLTVCGEGWESLSQSGHDIRGQVSAEETQRLMARSKITLNLLPPYYASHERVFQAMANGSVAATTPSVLWEDIPGVLSLPYDAEAAAAFLVDALADDEALQEMAAQGAEAFHGAHTWDHRVAEILTFVRSGGFSI